MPKLNKRPPKYCKLNQYAVVYQNGKPIYLGLHGSPESKVAYSRFIAEIQANQVFSLTKEERAITVCELTAAFLGFQKAKIESIEDRVGRSDAWKNRNDTLKEIYDSRPPSLEEFYDIRTIDMNSGCPDCVSEVEHNREHEDIVEEYLRQLHNRVLLGKITSAEYYSEAANLSPKDVAKWLKTSNPAFKGKSPENIEAGVLYSNSWRNREEILNTSEYEQNDAEYR